jgi:hypothetical protein
MRDHVRLEAAGVITITAITGLLVAGCTSGGSSAGSSGGSPAGTPAASSSASQAPDSAAPAAGATTSTAPPAVANGGGAGGPARCHTGQLSGRVRMMGAAAGNRYAALILTNTSGESCRTFGFVGLQLAGATGNKLPTTVVRETNPSPHGITLQPGQSAWTRLHWGAVPGQGESTTGPCEPEPSRLLVIPPDERTQLSARWPNGSVCEHGEIFVTALSPGTG